jgi:hypothetical protein
MSRLKMNLKSFLVEHYLQFDVMCDIFVTFRRMFSSYLKCTCTTEEVLGIERNHFEIIEFNIQWNLISIDLHKSRFIVDFHVLFDRIYILRRELSFLNNRPFLRHTIVNVAWLLTFSSMILNLEIIVTNT